MTMRCALWIGLVLACACDKGDAAKNDEIPAGLRGNYGQKAEQAQMPTVGLEVAPHALRLGELTVTIVQGEASPNGDYQVTKAEAVWEKGGRKAKTCKGTISRQGHVLLVKLFEEDADERCESVLEGEWKAWTRSEALPERVLGTYGAKAERADADQGLRIEAEQIGFTDDDKKMAVNDVVQWADKPDEAIIRDSTWYDFKCRGSIVRQDDEIVLTLTPSEGAPEGAQCPNGHGVRWSIDDKLLPGKPLSNGKVSIATQGGKLTVEATDIGLRCELAVLRTGTRTVSESRFDGIGVIGGAVFVLDKAEPTGGTEACRQRLRNLAGSRCNEDNGAPCSPDQLQAYTAEEPQCPRQIAIGDPSGGGQKVAFLPAKDSLLACWDTTGVFKP